MAEIYGAGLEMDLGNAALVFPRGIGGDSMYVSPEQFGAKGDGEHDDTAAIQEAVDSGFNVFFSSGKTYKCGQISITKNIIVDCNLAKFICTSDILFLCAGNVAESFAGSDYVAGEEYTLPSDDLFTGMAMLRSTENTIPARDNYRGGFAALFAGGVCSDRIPASFGHVTIDKINHISCTVMNIADVQFDAVRYMNKVIRCEYGYKSEFRNIWVNGDMHSVVNFYRCRDCLIEGVNGYVNYTGERVNYYPLGLEDSSFCRTEHCNLRSEWWHTWDTGGTYFCYGNTIDDCDFSTVGYAYSVADHENGMATRITNSRMNNVMIGGNGSVEDCIIRPAIVSSEGTIGCCVLLRPTNLTGANYFTVRNVQFLADVGRAPASVSNYGVQLRISAYNEIDTVVDDVLIENCKPVGTAVAAFSMLNINTEHSTGSTMTIKGDLVIDGCEGYFVASGTSDSFDSSCKLILRNLRRRAGHPVIVGLPQTIYPKTTIVENSIVNYIKGNLQELILENVLGASGESLLIDAQGDKLTGSDVGYIAQTALESFDSVRILGMRNLSGADAYSAVYAIDGQVDYVERIEKVPPTEYPLVKEYTAETAQTGNFNLVFDRPMKAIRVVIEGADNGDVSANAYVTVQIGVGKTSFAYAKKLMYAQLVSNTAVSALIETRKDEAIGAWISDGAFGAVTLSNGWLNVKQTYFAQFGDYGSDERIYRLIVKPDASNGVSVTTSMTIKVYGLEASA